MSGREIELWVKRLKKLEESLHKADAILEK